jgi:hypothetical protein
VDMSGTCPRDASRTGRVGERTRAEREERGGAAATPSDGRVRLVAEHHVREKSVRGRVARSERVHHHKASPARQLLPLRELAVELQGPAV